MLIYIIHNFKNNLCAKRTLWYNDDSNKINQLESSIMKLKSELQEEKNKNDLLSNEITKLKEQINNG